MRIRENAAADGNAADEEKNLLGAEGQTADFQILERSGIDKYAHDVGDVVGAESIGAERAGNNQADAGI